MGRQDDRRDVKYRRHGTANLFMRTQPRGGHHYVCITSMRKKSDVDYEAKKSAFGGLYTVISTDRGAGHCLKRQYTECLTVTGPVKHILITFNS